MIGNIDDIIKAIFLLILGISGNFIAETLGCKTQKLLTENMLVKHLVIIFIIFFVLGFTNKKKIHPLETLGNTLILWVFFVLFTRMSLTFTIIVFLLIALKYILTMYKEYYEENGENEKKDDKIIENLEKVGEYIIYLVGGMILIGFSLYFRKQYKEYYKDWSTYKFIFGVNKCKSLK